MFNVNNINTHEYNLYLCNIDKTIICALDYLDIQFEENFRQYDQLSFTVPLTDNGWRQIDNKFFNYLQPLYLILMEVKNGDNLIFREYFIVDSPTFNYDNGVTKKNIKCYSSDYIFNNFYLNSYEEVKLLYDPSGNNGILNDMFKQMENIWSVGYISDTLLNVYHSYNFSSNTYRSVIETLEEQFNCFFIFDTINNEINIYDASGENYGEDTNIIISDENYLKSLSCDIKNSEMVTKLKVWGKDNVTIAKYNPTGMLYLLDYSWARQNNRMSYSLSSAYDAWLELILNNETAFQNYLNTLNSLESSLQTKKNELNDLETALQVIEDALDILIDAHRRNTSEYDDVYDDKVSVLGQISSKKSQITNLEYQIDDVNADISALGNLLSLTNNFTLEQRKELSFLTIEGTQKFDTISDELQLYNYAKAYQQIKNKPSIDTTLDIIDLFSISDSYIEENYEKIKVGNYIYLDCGSLGFNYDRYRITQITHSKLSNSLSFTISNKDKLNTEIFYLNRIFKNSSEAADVVNTNKEDYSRYTQQANSILYNYSTIDTSETTIKSGSNYINQRGFTGNSLGSRNGAIKIQGDQIVFSSDGNFEDYYAILSPDGLYLETIDGKYRTIDSPYTGFQLDIWDTIASDWKNALYLGLDNNDNPALFIDNGYIQLLKVDNTGLEQNLFKVDPSVGLELSKNTSIVPNNPIWEKTFFVNANGDITHTGIFKTDTGLTLGHYERIELDGNGIKSYNSDNELAGLVIDKSSDNQFSDIQVYSAGSKYFEIYYDTPSVSFKSNGSSGMITFLNSYNGNTLPENTWNFSDTVVKGVCKTSTDARLSLNYSTTPTVRLNVYSENEYKGYIPLSI